MLGIFSHACWPSVYHLWRNIYSDPLPKYELLLLFLIILIYSLNFLNKRQKNSFSKNQDWASLLVQWLRICLAMQRTLVQSLVWEDPTSYRATKPMGHNHSAHVLQLPKPTFLEPTLPNKRSHHISWC